MDIAKYIGAFLLKNNFCYVHGLGNLEVAKIKATHDGSALQAPSYMVVVTPGGSIDDSLANFIATNEQISISKAANALREFSMQARKDMAQGKEVLIPNIGKFVEQNSKVKFITDDHFKYTPPGIPVIKNSKQLEEQSTKLSQKPAYPTPSRADSINWTMVIIVAALVIVLAGGGYGVYYYMNNSKSADTVATVPVRDTVVQAQPVPAAPDTIAARVDTANTVTAIDTNTAYPYRIVIGNYPSRDRADKRVKNLSAIGNTVETVMKDSTNYLVVTTIKCRPTDTTHVKDSLKALFGYKNVMTIK